MKSKLATAAKIELLAITQRLTAEERLNAFLAHSRLMVELEMAGRKLRESANPADDSSPLSAWTRSLS